MDARHGTSGWFPTFSGGRIIDMVGGCHVFSVDWAAAFPCTRTASAVFPVNVFLAMSTSLSERRRRRHPAWDRSAAAIRGVNPSCCVVCVCVWEEGSGGG